MGNQNIRYINTTEDIIEKCIKKGYPLQELLIKSRITSVDFLLNMKFLPYDWNIFHLAVWYNNCTLLVDLIHSNEFDKKFINHPDINGEPPVALCCVLDNDQPMGILIENGCLTKFENNPNYRKDLSLNVMCVIHDAPKCFELLNPDLSIDSDMLDDLYDMASKMNSEKIIALFDIGRPFLHFDANMEIKKEAEMQMLRY